MACMRCLRRWIFRSVICWLGHWGLIELVSLEYPYQFFKVYLEWCRRVITRHGRHRTNLNFIGEWEEIVVSRVKQAIPDSVKNTWHEWRASMKKVEADIPGSETVEEGVEMAGWGVGEAEKRNKVEASMNTLPHLQ